MLLLHELFLLATQFLPILLKLIKSTTDLTRLNSIHYTFLNLSCLAVGTVKQLCCRSCRQNVIFEAESKTTK